jgi:tetratricopeptide (TPR) repeat protein
LARQAARGSRKDLREAEACFAKGRYREAEKILVASLRSIESRKLPIAMELWNQLGIVYKYEGKFSAAVNAYSRARRLLERCASPGDLAFASIFHNLGGVAFSRGRYSDAERLTRRALRIRTRHCGAGDPDVAADLAALGAIFCRQKRYRSALNALTKARGIFAANQRARGRRYDLAITDNNIGAALHGLARYDEAERYFRSALRAKRKLLGPNHPDVGISLSNLGDVYYRLGRANEARRTHVAALAILKKTLGVNHPQTAAAIANYKKVLAE